VGPWYNRPPWNFVVAICVIAGIIVAISGVPWLIAAAPAYFIYLYVKLWSRRAIALRSKGYFCGRRLRDKWIYEERAGSTVNSLVLDLKNMEPGHWEMFFPSDKDWRRSVPPWAIDRRSEIARRIAEGWRPKDFHLPPDLKDT
jgi:hypothetical protein